MSYRLKAKVYRHARFDGDPMWETFKDSVAEEWEFTNCDFRYSPDRPNSFMLKVFSDEPIYDFEHDRSHLALFDIAVPQVRLDPFGRTEVRGFATDVRITSEIETEATECEHCTPTHKFGPYLPDPEPRLIMEPFTIVLWHVEIG